MRFMRACSAARAGFDLEMEKAGAKALRPFVNDLKLEREDGLKEDASRC